MTTDERNGFTSASAAAADALCPGRHLAQRGLPEEPPGEAAEKGTRIHAALASGFCPTDYEEARIFYNCEAIAGHVLAKHLYRRPSRIEFIKERRFKLHVGPYEHSGKPDLVALAGDEAVIVDYKTGYGEQEDSDSNMQLRDYAVLLWLAYPNLARIHVAVVQPAETHKPVVTCYETDDLLRAHNELVKRVIASNTPGAPRVAGEVQCKYCLAKLKCPAFLGSVAEVQRTAPTPEAVTESIAALPSPRLGEFVSICRLAEEAATTELRRRVEAGDTATGWTLEPGHTREKIVDVQRCFDNCSALGVTPEAFMRAVTITKKALTAAIKAHITDTPPAEAVKAATAGCTETEQQQPRLVRKSNVCVSDGPADAPELTRSAEGPFAARNG